MRIRRLTVLALITSISIFAAGCDATNSSAEPAATPAPPAAAAPTSAPSTPVAQAPASTSAPRTTSGQTPPQSAGGGVTSAAAPAAPAAPVAQAAPGEQPGTSSETVVRVYRERRPTTVTVISSVVQPGFRSEPGPQGTGTGFMIDGQGHILTNNHVVGEGNRLEVTLANGTTIPAQLVGRDSRFDLAVLRADVPADQLRPTALGDSDQIQIGEQVIAIGNPYGLEGTVTTGVVSSRRPLVSEPEGDGVLVNAIQTDASINPGNSGGPLLNARGDVIGVTTLGLMPNGGQAGLNFAIPINNAKRILDDLIARGSYPHPFVGIATAEITQTIAEQLGLPVGEGLLVQSVERGSGAAEAGLRAGSQQREAGARQIAAGGDIIVAVDGQPMKRPEDFVAYLELNKRAGDQLALTIVRDGRQQDVQVTLGERPSAQQSPSQQPGQRPGR